ncbi:chaperone protein dnaJ 49-like [Cocos nucifera]|uniref:Chaperone protein dnaJ 49-like n=1 Tax=Cocos nucifera TaxID=13894 RepID=A0A8K0I524_COCNU|nr:chaperone protein dnaJ 49-like [Cocos nucifera]
MDGNKDEALKCLRIGKQALDSGDQTRALKFLTKARRLDPSLPIDDLLSTAADGGSHDSSPSDGPGNPREEPERPTPDSASASSFATARSAAFSSSEGSSRAYTEEQITVVRQIKKQRDYYQILGLERNCTVEDVRKAYRKLSLKVHPDKNRAPGAEEAFKAVSKAFQCLSNEEGRKRYDLVGSEEPAFDRAAARRHARGFDGFYDADVDAEEIFRNFFFGGMAPAATSFGPFQFRVGGMGGPSFHQMQGGGNFNLRALIQILPIIILILLNFLPSKDPVYSFSRAYPYEHKIVTARGVPYFVKSPKFEQEYPYQSSERTSLEQHVERDYLTILAQNCRVELQRSQWGLSYQTPNCDTLRKFEETAS